MRRRYRYSAVRFSRADAAFRRQFDDFISRLEAMISRMPNARILQLELNRIKRWANEDMDYGLTNLEKFGRLHYTEFREFSRDYAGTLRNGINRLINSYR